MSPRPRPPAGRLRFGLSASSIAALGVLSAGCADHARVWGHVRCGGRPLTEGTVVLKPLELKTYTHGSGPLDSRGRFEIFCSRRDMALQPGMYWLSIRPPLQSDPGTGEIVAPPDYPVPDKYRHELESAIQIEVKPEPMKLELTLD